MPYTVPFVSRTSKRVSSRLSRFGFVSSIGKSKCLMKTVPLGNDHSPVGVKWTNVFVGRAIQRVFTAPSDQSGELTMYGMRLVSGASDARSRNAPVSESNGGNGLLAGGGPDLARV